MALYAFDGTGDRWDPSTQITPDARTANGRYLTNVVLFLGEYRKSGIQAHYFPGIATCKTPKILNKMFGVLGIGGLTIANRAFRILKQNFLKGDTDIDIVGYSRGAAIARYFADKIFNNYKQVTLPNGQKLNTAPRIRFLGLFDTVASFGNPLNDWEIFFQEHLPSTVENAFHAMALDMNRHGFGLDRAYGANVLEVWFRGGHGDIGGNSVLSDGSPNRLRSNIALNFMLRKAKAVGIELSEVDYPSDPQAPICIDDNNRKEKDPSRQPRKDDVYHYSCFAEDGQPYSFLNCNPLASKNLLSAGT